MLEGDLTDFTLPDVLRLLAFTAKTGRLTLRDGERRGRVDLVDGRVRDASADARRVPLARRVLGTGLVDGDTLLDALTTDDRLPTDLELARTLASRDVIDAGALAELVREQTLDATFDLLRWPAGAFRFAVGPGPDRPGVLDLAVPVDELLDEATRRLEAWPALVDRTGTPTATVSIARPRRVTVVDGGHDVARPPSGEVELPPDGWTLLALVDGRRTVGDLVALSGQGEYRTRRTLGALLDEGVIAIGDAAGDGPLERLLHDHAALAARERALAAAGLDGEPGPAGPPAPPAAPPVAPAAETPAEVAPAAETPVEVAPAAEASVEVAPTAEAPVEAPAVGAPADVAPDRPTAVRPLRTRVRSDRLRTDPTVDEDLVTRLIEGVEGL